MSSPGSTGRSSNHRQALSYPGRDYWMPAFAGMTKESSMVRVVGIDHLVLSVGDFERSKSFYAPLMEFLGFGVEAEYEGMMGWANGKTLFWISQADAEGKTHKYRKGDIGFHHYAFRLRSRKDVDALQAYLARAGRQDRRSRRRILRRLLRRVLSRSRRHEARRHALWREARAGRQEARGCGERGRRSPPARLAARFAISRQATESRSRTGAGSR